MGAVNRIGKAAKGIRKGCCSRSCPQEGYLGRGVWGGLPETFRRKASWLRFSFPTFPVPFLPRQSCATEVRTSISPTLRYSWCASPTPMLRTTKWKKTCNACVRRKRKCDGQAGAASCSHCIETHQTCVFGRIKPRESGIKRKKTNKEAEPRSAVLANTQGRIVAPKWSTATASAAVGMVGLQENQFLAAFMRDFNAMIPCAASATILNGMCAQFGGGVGALLINGDKAEHAVFWGAIAMGSKILNAPAQLCNQYLALSNKIIEACSGPSTSVVEAYSLLSLASLLLGKAQDYDRHQANVIAKYKQLLESNSGAHADKLDENVEAVVGFMSTSPADSSTNSMVIAPEYRGMFSQLGVAALTEIDVGDVKMSRTTPLLYSILCSMGAIIDDIMEIEQTPANRKEKCDLLERMATETETMLRANPALSSCVLASMPVLFGGGAVWCVAGKLDKAERWLKDGIKRLLEKRGMVNYPLIYHSMHAGVAMCVRLGNEELYGQIRDVFKLCTFTGKL
ncbi:unnamed protein product [Chrysoparadoxa australica]